MATAHANSLNCISTKFKVHEQLLIKNKKSTHSDIFVFNSETNNSSSAGEAVRIVFKTHESGLTLNPLNIFISLQKVNQVLTQQISDASKLTGFFLVNFMLPGISSDALIDGNIQGDFFLGYFAFVSDCPVCFVVICWCCTNWCVICL